MNAEKEEQHVCPECGATIQPEAEICWLCHSQSDAVPAGESPFAPGATVTAGESPFAQSEHHAGVQFSLASMMLLVTLTAVILGLFVTLPGLGILLSVMVAPALIRTAILASRRRTVGRPMDMRTKVWVFTGTLGLLAVIVTAAAGAFVATCFPLGFAAFGAESGFLFGLAWVAGFGVAIFVLYVLVRAFRRLWPRGE